MSSCTVFTADDPMVLLDEGTASDDITDTAATPLSDGTLVADNDPAIPEPREVIDTESNELDENKELESSIDAGGTGVDVGGITSVDG